MDYVGRGELQLRQAALGGFLGALKQMSEEFNITVFMTNQVQSDPGASALCEFIPYRTTLSCFQHESLMIMSEMLILEQVAGADGRKPIGGHVLAHASTTRVLLRKGESFLRITTP